MLNPECPSDCSLDPEYSATFSEIYIERSKRLDIVFQFVRCRVADDPQLQRACSGNPDSPKAVFVPKR